VNRETEKEKGNWWQLKAIEGIKRNGSKRLKRAKGHERG